MNEKRSRYIHPGGMTPAFQAVNAYRAACEALNQARKVRDDYWSKFDSFDGMKAPELTEITRLGEAYRAAHRVRELAAFAANIDPYNRDPVFDDHGPIRD